MAKDGRRCLARRSRFFERRGPPNPRRGGRAPGPRSSYPCDRPRRACAVRAPRHGLNILSISPYSRSRISLPPLYGLSFTFTSLSLSDQPQNSKNPKTVCDCLLYVSSFSARCVILGRPLSAASDRTRTLSHFSIRVVFPVGHSYYRQEPGEPLHLRAGAETQANEEVQAGREKGQARSRHPASKLSDTAKHHRGPARHHATPEPEPAAIPTDWPLHARAKGSTSR